MSIKVVLQPAYLLHTWPYRETSALADLLTQDFGRIRMVIKGMHQVKSRYHGIRPFTPLLISYGGKSELFNLLDLETTAIPYELRGDVLFCGFYLNELLLRLLQPQDPYPLLFLKYQEALEIFSKNATRNITRRHVEPILRQFELSILMSLGYGFSLDETDMRIPVVEENYYLFDPKRGLLNAPYGLKADFKGKYLLNFKHNQWPDVETYSTAKKLMQMALAPLLGKKALKTKVVFKELS